MITRREDQVVLLNRDLMGEHQAIVHYLMHAWTVVRHFGDAIEEIARDEMRHFKWLAHAIVALGGVPDLTPPDLLPVFSQAEALDYDIDAEEEAISQYLAHCREIDNTRVQNLISRIVVDERDHRRRFIALRVDAATETTDPFTTTDTETPERFQLVVSREYQNILRSLFESFLSQHARQVGLEAEDRAVDEMKHMGWIAEVMAERGQVPRFTLSRTPDGEDELTLYESLRQWAQDEMQDMVPVLDRMIQHEQYHRKTAADPEWTVGSASEGGWH